MRYGVQESCVAEKQSERKREKEKGCKSERVSEQMCARAEAVY